MTKKVFLMFALACVANASSAQSAFTEKKTEFEVFAGVSLNDNVGGDVNDTKMKIGFHAGVAGRYNIIEGLFAEGAIAFATKGYKCEISRTSGKTWDDYGPNYDAKSETKMSTYNIDVPLSIGYCFTLTDNMKINVKAGPYLTYALFGEMEQKGYITYYPDIHSGETEHINNTVKLSDMFGFA